MGEVTHRRSGIGVCMTEKQSGVYLIRNTVNGKVYVGSSVNIRARWRQHRSDLKHQKAASCHFQAAWNKYGEQAFEFSILELCCTESVDVVEQKFIDSYEAANWRHGYNICREAGKRGCGLKPISDETRRKMSEAKKGKPSWRKGKSLIESHKANMRGRVVPEETREKISATLTGRKNGPQTEETKRKISKAITGVKRSESHKLAVSHAHSKFTCAEARNMASLRLSGLSYCKIASQYGCTREAVRKILSGKTLAYGVLL